MRLKTLAANTCTFSKCKLIQKASIVMISRSCQLYSRYYSINCISDLLIALYKALIAIQICQLHSKCSKYRDILFEKRDWSNKLANF